MNIFAEDRRDRSLMSSGAEGFHSMKLKNAYVTNTIFSLTDQVVLEKVKRRKVSGE